MKTSTTKFILTLTIGLTLILGIMMAAFSLPAVHSGINRVPIGIVENDEDRFQKLETSLAEKGFKVSRYKDSDQVKTNIEKREIYGAFVFTKTGELTVYEATAASSAVAQLITQVAEGMVQQQQNSQRQQLTQLIDSTSDSNQLKRLITKLNDVDQKKVKIINVRSFPNSDPKGTGLAAGALPIALGGWIGAVAIANMVKGKKQKFWATTIFSIIGGFGLVSVIQYGIGTFNGNYFLTSLGAILGIAATGFFVLGLLEILGGAGLGIAAIILILLGNPLSGLTSAPEMLPNGWGEFGQMLPPGATGTLLRNIVFFDGNATMQPIIVLTVYVLIGGLLFKLGNKSEI